MGIHDGKLAGISNIEDQSSDRVGLRIVVELKRDAVAKVVLNNLYKHTQLQTSFGANMLSIVDGVPRLEGEVAGKPARLDHAYLDVDDSGSVPSVKPVGIESVMVDTAVVAAVPRL